MDENKTKQTDANGTRDGISAVVTTITQEGIVTEAERVDKVQAASEFDQNVWTIQGRLTLRSSSTDRRPSALE